MFQSDGGDRLLHIATVVPEGKARNRGRSRERTETDKLISRFWAGLLEHAKPKTRLHAKCKPTNERFLGASAGMLIKGVTLKFYYYVRAHGADVAFDITGQEQERIFEALDREKEEIEGKFGSELDWNRKPRKKHCRIKKTCDGGYRDEERWEAVFDVLASAMANLESALKPHLHSGLRVS